MSDTPRTDKIENDWKESWDRSTGQKEMACFARQLERELNAFHDELSNVMPSDYKDWWQNSKAEWPLVARLTIQNLREREQSALEDLERLERELNEAHAMNAELRESSIDLLKSLPVVGCSELHHEKADQHTLIEDCPVLFRYKSAIDQMRISLTNCRGILVSSTKY